MSELRGAWKIAAERGITYGEALEVLREQREANKAAKAARLAAKEASPIAEAVRPLKDDAVKAAVQWADARIEYVRAEMEKAGWDREVAAPHPRGNLSRLEYMKAKHRYQLFHAVTKGREATRRSHDPDFADMSPEGCERFIDECKEQAAAQYEAFVEKLVYKIGETTSAKLEGNHVWARSVLTVTKPDGSVEKWKTQQITNVSKLGKYFPQWPSRKLKK